MSETTPLYSIKSTDTLSRAYIKKEKEKFFLKHMLRGHSAPQDLKEFLSQNPRKTGNCTLKHKPLWSSISFMRSKSTH